MEFIFAGLGAIFASFLNALAYRLNTEDKIDNIWATPSHCEVCKKRLRWFDMIPVVSYMFTWGKCSQCGNRVFWYYPISEAFLVTSFALFTLFNVSLVPFLVLLFLFFLSYFDVVSKSIPKDITDVFFILSMAYALVQICREYSPLLLITVVFAITLFVSGYILSRSKKEVFGLGDVIVLTSLTLLSGLEIGVLTISVTVLVGGLFAITLVIIDKRNMKRYIPLVPFITLGYSIAIIVIESNPDFYRAFPFLPLT